MIPGMSHRLAERSRSNSPPTATHGLRAALEQLRQSDTEAENTQDNQP